MLSSFAVIDAVQGGFTFSNLLSMISLPPTTRLLVHSSCRTRLIADDTSGSLSCGRLRKHPLAEALLAASAIARAGDQLQVRAWYEAHLLGATLRFRAMPFTQQDTRISACAQASIWMCGRHFHVRHRGPWYSTADITRAASTPIDADFASSLPAGGSGLGLNNMLRALKAMERHPYIYVKRRTSTGQVEWPNQLDPTSIILRYTESGIPIILMLRFPNQDIGHAVVALGTTFDTVPVLSNLPLRPTVAQFCNYILVNDDSTGVQVRMPVRPHTPRHGKLPTP